METKAVSTIARNLYKQYGQELFADDRRLKAVLADVLPHYQKEHRLLCLAIDEGICRELLKNADMSVAEYTLLEQRFSDSYGLNDETAKQIVGILRFAIYGGVSCVTPPPPPPPPQPPKKYWHIIGAIGCIIAIFAWMLKWDHDQVVATTAPISEVARFSSTPAPTPTQTPQKTESDLQKAGKPTISAQPQNEINVEAGSATFQITAIGEDLSYQWQFRENSSKNWSNCSDYNAYMGERTRKLMVNINIIKSGYQYRCMVTNEAGTVYSDIVTLNLTPGAYTTPNIKWGYLSTLDVGDTMWFGKYRQHINNYGLGTESIEWEVLAKEDDCLLVISKNILERIPYASPTTTYVPAWDDSAVCQWLNNTFLSEAFSEEEQGMIKTVKVTNSVRDSYNKIFLLNAPEAQKYFHSDSDRISYAAEAISSNDNWETTGRAWESQEYGRLSEDYRNSWLLRCEGSFYECAAYVDGNGAIREAFGNGLGNYINGVRPAMWIRTR